MKNFLRLIILANLTLLLVGGWYKTFAYISNEEKNVVTQKYLDTFLPTVPDVVIGFLVYTP